MSWTVLLPGVLAFLLVLTLTPIVKRVAHQTGLVAMPKADRWHRTKIPLLGGVGIVIGALVAVAFAAPSTASVWVLLGCAAGLAIDGEQVGRLVPPRDGGGP